MAVNAKTHTENNKKTHTENLEQTEVDPTGTTSPSENPGNEKRLH